MKANIHLLLVLFFFSGACADQIAIVGCGYVGLTTAAILSNGGHSLVCIDINKEKIGDLQSKILPMYEPQLYELLFESNYSQNILFSYDMRAAMGCDIFYICADTPTDARGFCDYSSLYGAFDSIIALLKSAKNKIICVKSTVPLGTMQKLIDRMPSEYVDGIDVVYNPEFMREGSAIQDVYKTNPVVLAGPLHSVEKIEDLYKSFLDTHINIIKTNYETAEMIKYAWNAFSAIRISYINELADLCRVGNADIWLVIQCLALSESLLPTASLRPGPGYGGSCLPKDTASFSKIMEKYGFDSSMVHQAIMSNKNHQDRVIDNIFNLLGSSRNQKVVTLLGLAFKAHTNDIRNSIAIPIIKALLAENIIVRAYDAYAINDMKKIFPSIAYFECPYDALENTDLVVVLTECETLEELDFNKVESLCRQKKIIDARNMYNPMMLKRHGFIDKYTEPE